MSLSQLDIQKEARYFLHKPKREKLSSFYQKPKVIVIAGPTGVGKSSLAVSIAKILNGEIVSMDAIQVYRGMDIGTAKLTNEERQNIPHHMIDIRDVDEKFNVVEFTHEAKTLTQNILARGKVPILVGGSGFYLRAFLYGPPTGPAPDQEFRNELEQKWEMMGKEVMYEQLQMLDPEYAKTISEHDKHKILRALEIIALTKKPVSSFPYPSEDLDPSYDFRLWLITLPKEILLPKLDRRCEEMIEKGLIEEVKKLSILGLKNNLSASHAIGYRQVLEFLETPMSSEDQEKFLQKFKIATHQYVKRQLTWFRKELYFRWLDIHRLGFEKTKETILQDYFDSSKNFPSARNP